MNTVCDVTYTKYSTSENQYFEWQYFNTDML
jgi:hypothetical protein